MFSYGVNTHACSLVASYFTCRKQRVKIGNIKSEWLNVQKGAPQGSLFGPFSYNIFSNDLLLLMTILCDIYNYADDNTICCDGESYEVAYHKLTVVIKDMMKWFKENYLQANPTKFQYIVFEKNQTVRWKYIVLRK